MKTTTTNLFNTYADFGKGPLKAHAIQNRTLFDILFSDELLIPGTSLLCNPATDAFIKNNPDLLEGFLKSGKIHPIVTDKNKTFAELTGFLKSRNSVSLNVQDIKITEKNAEFIDSCLDQKNLVIISQKE
ncbi:hypothetical protein JW926_09765, partial [Candidatus Sumerlaeota bacterium]|nr:hypothetical protein [Candidatus Sumerlaeota bacterium]